MKITIRDQELILDQQRAIYFPQQQLLAISDLHLGKAAHFRKSGLQIPSTLAQSDLQRLGGLINKYQPLMLLINGDMFHHSLNSDTEDFQQWKANYQHINFILVKGNHDRLDEEQYHKLGIAIHDPSYRSSNFCFIHDALKCKQQDLYPISGHIHPGISIIGNAKQRLKFPCFYFGNDYAIMPAFSEFTGLQIVKPKLDEQVYAITPTKVLKVY